MKEIVKSIEKEEVFMEDRLLAKMFDPFEFQIDTN